VSGKRGVVLRFASEVLLPSEVFPQATWVRFSVGDEQMPEIKRPQNNGTSRPRSVFGSISSEKQNFGVCNLSCQWAGMILPPASVDFALVQNGRARGNDCLI